MIEGRRAGALPYPVTASGNKPIGPYAGAGEPRYLGYGGEISPYRAAGPERPLESQHTKFLLFPLF